MSNKQESPVIYYAISFVVVALCIGLFVSPYARNKLSEIRKNPERKILSTLEFDLTGQGHKYKIVKLVTSEGIVLEIYSSLERDKFVTSFNLGTEHDGHLTLEGKATNLATKDLDGDQVREIIVPSFSESYEPRVNVYRFNLNLLTFEEITHLDLPIGS